MDWLIYALIAIVGYFLGNFSTGLIIGRAVGHIDIRQHGSGNAGTTNILRTLGWLPSALTLIGDALKAYLAAMIGLWLMGDMGARIGGIFAVVGHNWPVLFGFKGGKGMAASLGAILAVDPWIALILLVIQLVVLAITRYMSVASIASAVAYAILMPVLRWGRWDQIACALILSALALYCHRSNIARLLSRNENRLDFSKINKLSSRKKS